MNEDWFPAGGQSGWHDSRGNPTFVSHLWTGRAPWAGSPVEMAARIVRPLLYPTYGCERCIGQDLNHGCYCAVMGAVAPCTAPHPKMVILRWLAERLLGVRA